MASVLFFGSEGCYGCSMLCKTFNQLRVLTGVCATATLFSPRRPRCPPAFAETNEYHARVPARIGWCRRNDAGWAPACVPSVPFVLNTLEEQGRRLETCGDQMQLQRTCMCVCDLLIWRCLNEARSALTRCVWGGCVLALVVLWRRSAKPSNAHSAVCIGQLCVTRSS